MRAEQSRAEQSRYLYAVKAVAALLVVVLHLKVNSALLNGISRCAVLTFLMISGYYTSIDSQDIQNILVKRIERLLKILLSASSIYLLKDLVFLANWNITNCSWTYSRIRFISYMDIFLPCPTLFLYFWDDISFVF